jgi:hypothetical protein
MTNFKSFYNDMFSTTGTRRFVNGPRHRKTGFTDTDRYYRRKSQNLVADMYKKDNSKNQKIEQLKVSNGVKVCTPQDLQYIQQTFGIKFDGTSKKLGKTGIIIQKDPNTDNIILRK